MNYDKKFKLDSFKIRLPIDKCIISELISNYIIVNETSGEVLPYNFKKNSYIINESGIKYYFAIERQRIDFKSDKEFLVILITAKILKSDYLEGITNNNVNKVYNELISKNVCYFDYETFLQGEIVDVDIKFDIYNQNFDIISGLTKLIKDDVKIFELIKVYERKNNKGFQISKRETTNFNKYPFLKVYDKRLNMINENKEFTENYLLDKIELLDKRYRIEFTIKNKKHLSKYNLPNKLGEFLTVENDRLLNVYLDIIDKYFNLQQIEAIKIKSDLAPTDIIILTAMDLLIQTKMITPEKIINELTKNIEQKQTRYRKRKELMVLFDKHIKLINLEKIKATKEKEQALKSLLIPSQR